MQENHLPLKLLANLFEYIKWRFVYRWDSQKLIITNCFSKSLIFSLIGSSSASMKSMTLNNNQKLQKPSLTMRVQWSQRAKQTLHGI